MKTIHISPYAHLGLAEQDMHLLIAPFLNDNEAYKEFYQKLPESHYTGSSLTPCKEGRSVALTHPASVFLQIRRIDASG